jgi:hypothetical protein
MGRPSPSLDAGQCAPWPASSPGAWAQGDAAAPAARNTGRPPFGAEKSTTASSAASTAEASGSSHSVTSYSPKQIDPPDELTASPSRPCLSAYSVRSPRAFGSLHDVRAIAESVTRSSARDLSARGSCYASTDTPGALLAAARRAVLGRELGDTMWL